LATRIFELARELGVKSKDVLEKLRAEGVDIKNHMSSVSAGLEATIREWFSVDGGAHTAVETTEHIDVEEARKRAEKSRRKTKKQQEDEAVAQAKAEAEAQATEEAEKASEEPVEEPTAEDQQPAEAEAQPPAEQKPAAVKTPAEPVAAETGESQAQPTAAAAAEEEAAPPAEKQPEAEEQKPQEADQTEEPEGEEAEEAEEEDNVKPAGPQVVPKPAKLKGPRVVRVEEPEYAPRPKSRQQPMQPPPGLRSPGMHNLKDQRESDDDRDKRKRSAKRSPRRKAGRSGVAETGEKLKEWRNRDLLERSERLAAASGGLRRRRASISRGGGKSGGGGVKTGQVEIDEPISIKKLSAETGLKTAVIIRQLMGLGHMATINEVIDTELAETICAEHDIELVVRKAQTAEEKMLEAFEKRKKGEEVSRAPVVTFLGHVDHGKTSLLDHIRKAMVASGEAGGITQAIGAYRHDQGDKHVVFLDTPGHEAFTAMRSRGANMTDVVVLVVAADDGVMPQTIEAINHAKAAGVPIVVALNKIDLPNANINKAMGQLAEHDLQPQEWGGDTEVVKTSAETGEGIDDLLELLSLESEMLELKASPDAPANGYVVEARMDPGRGVLTTLLNLSGTLRVGDVLLAGRGYGKVRQIYDDKGETLQEAPPATPVAVTGLDEVPEAGDRFFVVEDLDEARAVAEERRSEDRRENLSRGGTGSPPKTLAELLGQIEKGESHSLPIILKADVQGSVEALVGSLEKLGSDETRLEILHTAVGGITTGDVTLAEASGAVIIGFNVVADPAAKRLADEKGIDIRLYRVIYDIIDDLKRALEEGLAPEIREETLGQAEVRQIFKISRLGTIAGCYVTDGVAQRNAKVRIIRNNVVLEDERELDSLKRVKDDAREVKAGLECGLKIKGYDDIKEGDVIEFYKEVEVARTL
jgi:translation initiation factor IF-2